MPNPSHRPSLSVLWRVLGLEPPPAPAASPGPSPGPQDQPEAEADHRAQPIPALAAAPSPLPTAPAPRTVGPAGVALIREFEACARARRDGRFEAYPDPGTGAEPWTIGWGATGTDDVLGGRIGPGTIWTRAQCDARLERDLARYAAEVARTLGDAPTRQCEFDALVSFHYNTGAIARATLTARHKAGDREGAAREFARWNRAGGRVMRGLVRRRAAEAALYLSR